MTVGRSVRDPDWMARTTGSTPYVPDLEPPGVLVAAILRSPHPHARIRAIDTTAAAELPGVIAMLSGSDFPRQYAHEIPDRYPFARNVVRFVGEEVAAVAAETVVQAAAALDAIRVNYEPLPAVTTVEEALGAGAPRLHDRPSGNNISFHLCRRYGDAKAARAATATEVGGTYRFPRQAHACMETNGTLASWDANRERLDVWTSTQAPLLVRAELAGVLGLAPEQVVVHEIAVGGGFGSKSRITDHEAIAAGLSMRARRPVRLVLTREEEFATTKSRHAFSIDLRTGATADGRLTLRTARMTVDNGAYNHSGPSVTAVAAAHMASMYRTVAVDIEADLVDTNHNPGGQFRGYGGPQVVFAVESQLDEVADRLGIDPIDIRIRNAHQPGDITHTGWRLNSVCLADCLKAVRETIDWDTKRALGGSGRGIGIATSVHVSGARVSPDANQSEAAIDLFNDGRVRVRFGGADPGTGLRTILAQVVAEELKVKPETIEVVTMDTATTTFDLGSWSSRGTTMAGLAARAVGQSAALRLREIAAEVLGVDSDQVRLEDACAVTETHRLALADLVSRADPSGRMLTIVESASVDTDLANPETGVANVSASYAFAAHAVEVEVDRDTGQVKVLQVVTAHDSGRIINPRAATGQVVGGVVMGLGAALGEQLLDAGGRMVNPNFLHYALPRAADAPTVRTLWIEHTDPHGPYGAKSLGEIAIEPVAAAVANAVAHATGLRVRELPITPDKILAGLGARRARPQALWRRPNRWWPSLVRAAYPRGLFMLLHRYGTRFARCATSTAIDTLNRPNTVEDAVARLHDDPTAVPIGGGTDLLPACRQGLTAARHVVDLTLVPDLRTVRQHGSDLVIGGAVTLAELMRAPETEQDTSLRAAISSIASPQIREMATVAGNLCQQKRCWFYRNDFPCYKRGGVTCPCYAVLGGHAFYHAVLDAHRCQAVTPSDLATLFIAMDATVRLTGSKGTRAVPVAKLYVGPGETCVRQGEILTDVRIPASARARRTAFAKLGLWHGDFAVASACAALAIDGEIVTDARVILGAVAPTPFRAVAVERRLLGRRIDPELIAQAAGAWTSRTHPLRDNRWKVDLACGLIRRVLTEASA